MNKNEKETIKTMRTQYESTIWEKGLEVAINEIGYKNILSILPCYCDGKCFYTIIYKEN